MFNVNSNGDTRETDDQPEGSAALFLGQVFSMLGDALTEADNGAQKAADEIAAELNGWDGSFNADDIEHLTTALSMVNRYAYHMASEALNDITPDNFTEALAVTRAARQVMKDCAVLTAKLEAAMARHPHTISVTPF